MQAWQKDAEKQKKQDAEKDAQRQEAHKKALKKQKDRLIKAKNNIANLKKQHAADVESLNTQHGNAMQQATDALAAKDQALSDQIKLLDQKKAELDTASAAAQDLKVGHMLAYDHSTVPCLIRHQLVPPTNSHAAISVRMSWTCSYSRIARKKRSAKRESSQTNSECRASGDYSKR